MLKETAAAAVAKLGTDFPDVTSRDLGAAQGAMAVRARAAIIDKNEAEHVGPPPGTGFLVGTQRDFHRHLLLGRFTSQNGYSRSRHLVIAPQVSRDDQFVFIALRVGRRGTAVRPKAFLQG